MGGNRGTGEQAFMLFFGQGFFFFSFSSAVLVQKHKNNFREANRPLGGMEGSFFCFFTGLLAAHMPQVFFVFFAIWLSELFPVVIKS